MLMKKAKASRREKIRAGALSIMATAIKVGSIDLTPSREFPASRMEGKKTLAKSIIITVRAVASSILRVDA